MIKCLFFSKKNLWSDRLFKRLKSMQNICWEYCDSLEDYKKFEEEEITWAFFFHWGNIVPESIYKNHRCVVLHTSNLPDFRGGSPIQNQILSGVKHSKVNAIKMVKKIDAGPVYCCEDVSLQGSLTDIWLNISDKSFLLIEKCVKESLEPKEQKLFKPVVRRRKTSEIPINQISTVEKLHDYIRMLDAEGYSRSFVKVGPLRIEFSRSMILNDKKIITDATICLED